MESKIKLFGHPLHPILIVFPLGLLLVAVIFDTLYVLTRRGTFAIIAFYDMAAGIVGGVVAAAVGLVDWVAIPDRTRAKQIGLFHALTNSIVIVLFSASWLTRLHRRERRPSIGASLIAAAGAGLSGLGGWLGGELVDRLGVGVAPGANLNAPSSLSDSDAAAFRWHE